MKQIFGITEYVADFLGISDDKDMWNGISETGKSAKFEKNKMEPMND